MRKSTVQENGVDGISHKGVFFHSCCSFVAVQLHKSNKPPRITVIAVIIVRLLLSFRFHDVTSDTFYNFFKMSSLHGVTRCSRWNLDIGILRHLSGSYLPASGELLQYSSCEGKVLPSSQELPNAPVCG